MTDTDVRATGLRAYLVCGLVGLMWLVVLAASQAVSWGQVPLGDVYPHVRWGVNVAFWASAAALFVSTLGARLNARRVTWGLALTAPAFFILALRPPEPVAGVMVAIAAATAIQAGFFVGELGKLVRLAPRTSANDAKAQAVVNGVFTFGLAPVVWGVASLATAFGPGMFLVLAFACLATFVVARLLYRSSPPAPESVRASAAPATEVPAPGVRAGLRSSGWSRRTMAAFVLNALSSGTTAANLAMLPTVLAQEGFGGPNWQGLVFAMHLPAGIAVLLGWAWISHRWADSGLRVAATWQAVGTLLLAIGMLLDDWRFIALQLVGFLVLNTARAAYNGSILACVGSSGANGAILLVGAAFGAAVGGQFATVVVPAGGVTPEAVGLVFGVLCLAGTLLWRAPRSGRRR